MSEEPFSGWAIIELFGHRRLGGYVSDVAMFGGRMLRIDIPGADPTTAGMTIDGHPIAATQFYGHASLFSCTPCTPELAIAVARANTPRPYAALPTPAREEWDEEDLDDADNSDDQISF